MMLAFRENIFTEGEKKPPVTQTGGDVYGYME